MNWVQALKEWNTGKTKWCVPRKGSPEYDEVRELMREGHTTEKGRESFLRSERDKAEELYYKYEDSKSEYGKKVRDKAAELISKYDSELQGLDSARRKEKPKPKKTPKGETMRDIFLRFLENAEKGEPVDYQRTEIYGDDAYLIRSTKSYPIVFIGSSSQNTWDKQIKKRQTKIAI